MLTAQELRELLHYDPESGAFTWKVCLRRGQRVGDVAGTLNNWGYIIIGIKGRRYMASRLAWLYMTGAWPPVEIDHRDLQSANNCWSNLREATRAQNGRNRSLQSNSTSGLKGVTRRGGKWEVNIKVQRRQHYLGRFDTAQAAHAAYVAAAARLHGEFARTA